MTDEETKTEETKEPKTDEDAPKDEANGVPLSIVDEAKAVRDEILKAKDELKVQNDRKEKLQSESLLASSAGAPIEAPTISPEKAASNKRVMDVGLASGAQWAKKMDGQDVKERGLPESDRRLPQAI